MWNLYKKPPKYPYSSHGSHHHRRWEPELSRGTAVWGSAYLAEVQRVAEQRRAQRQSVREEASKRLVADIRAWYCSLSESDRPAQLLMAELAKKFSAPPSEIGLALHELGFRRKRHWNPSEPHRRVWVPPP
jgi:hypothetical protein